MSESNEFLKFVIHEELYLIDDDYQVGEVAKKEIVPPVAPVIIDAPVKKPAPIVRTNSILVLFDNPSAKGMLETERTYLAKIVGSIGQTLEAIDFQNINDALPDIEGYKFVLSFTPNHKLGIDMATLQYEKIKFKASQLIIADALTNIAASPDLRQKLWTVLQKTFL